MCNSLVYENGCSVEGVNQFVVHVLIRTANSIQ